MAELQPFIPENPLEEAIAETKAGRATTEDMLRWIMHSTVLVASLTEVTDDPSAFKPMLMGENPDEPFLAVFTAPSRQALHGELAPHVLSMLGRDCFLRVPPRYGVIINAGSEAQLVFPQFGVEEIKAKLQYGQL